MRHRPRRRDLLDFQSDSVCLVGADPNREHRITLNVFQNDNWSSAVRIHHQCSDLYLDFHKRSTPYSTAELFTPDRFTNAPYRLFVLAAVTCTSPNSPS